MTSSTIINVSAPKRCPAQARAVYLRRTTLLSCLLFAASCGVPANEPASIRVGIIASLKGALAESIGRSSVESAYMAVELAHARGGLKVNGRRYRVELIVADAMDRPEVAVQAARKLINQDGVTALIGPILSRNALDVATVAESRQTPMISPASSHSDLTAGRKYVFRATFTDDIQGRALAHFAREDLGAHKAGILYEAASAHNRRVAEIFQHAFSNLGGQVVASETYTSGERDFSHLLAKIHAARPEVLLLPNYADDVPSQVQQAREMGLASIFLGSDAWDGTAFPDQAGFENSFFTDDWQQEIPDLATAESQAFAQAYQQIYGRAPNTVAALTYDAMGLLFAAIENCTVKTGFAPDGESIRRELARIEDYRGVTGNLTFKGGGDPIKGVTIFEIREKRLTFKRWIQP